MFDYYTDILPEHSFSLEPPMKQNTFPKIYIEYEHKQKSLHLKALN